MSAAIVIRHPPGYGAERRYAYEVVMTEFLGLSVELILDDREDLEITLSEGSPDASLRVADVLFATAERDWLKEASLPPHRLRRVNLGIPDQPHRHVADPLPVLYGNGPALEKSGRRWRLGIDVFGSTFFLLTRYEEIACAARDDHDRFPSRGSLAERELLLDRPLANEYADLLWSLLAELWPRLRRRSRRATLRLTHDVDLPHCRIPRYEARRLAIRNLKRETAPVAAVRHVLTASLGGRVPRRYDLYNTFDLIMRRSEELGLRSSFYFMAGNTGGGIDGNYSIDDPWILRLLRRISDRGHEVGLHPSYNTFLDAEATARELRALSAACSTAGVKQSSFGGRQHYLRWANPSTWQNWEDAGLINDSTLGFADHAGFRAGTCYEYPVFNLVSRRRLQLRERPLIVMDASLLDYQLLSLEDAAQEIIRLSAITRRFDGELNLLWHNDRLLSRRARRAYSAAIAGAARAST